MSGAARRSAQRLLSGLRARAYSGAALRGVPGPLLDRLRLEVPPAGMRRVEIGSGWRPTPGYLHVEPAPGRPDVHLVADAAAVPLPAGWADAILSVHVVEHLPAGTLPAVLRHWHQLLRPGGRLELHTPDLDALAAVLTNYDPAAPGRWWAAQGALFGYHCAPDPSQVVESLGRSPEHVVSLSWPALRDLLLDAGFVEIENVSGQLDCRHQQDWAGVVPGLCLEVRARACGQPDPANP